MKISRVLFLSLFAAFLSQTAAAETLQVDWNIEGLVYEGNTFNALSLDLDLLPRYPDVNGVIKYSNGLFLRPVNGTCIFPEITNNIVCTLRLDSWTLNVTLSLQASGSIELFDPSTKKSLALGILELETIK